MAHYLVRVHCCGSAWIVHVPAVDRWTLVHDKRVVAEVARWMIADFLGRPGDSFDLDLSAGRAVGGVEEFAVGSPVASRWERCHAR